MIIAQNEVYSVQVATPSLKLGDGRMLRSGLIDCCQDGFISKRNSAPLITGPPELHEDRKNRPRARDDVKLMFGCDGTEPRERYPPLSISLPFLAVGALPMMTTCHRMFLRFPADPQPSDPAENSIRFLTPVEAVHGHPLKSRRSPQLHALLESGSARTAYKRTIQPSPPGCPGHQSPPPALTQAPSDRSPPLHISVQSEAFAGWNARILPHQHGLNGHTGQDPKRLARTRPRPLSADGQLSSAC
ncbi:hypothetical protein FQA47_003122 [Oryzias melastigma]|uniref:Uncharacterized protein n=1 Tax=Oryzias melastigma TaxID=30732 RepID=A0A834EYV7_ORYME|nr:hypothetical protein FQA47_003122 [Oryzias melastigma]